MWRDSVDSTKSDIVCNINAVVAVLPIDIVWKYVIILVVGWF